MVLVCIVLHCSSKGGHPDLNKSVCCIKGDKHRDE